MTGFAMFRIIGNALPPRHSRSDNLRAINYILRHEPRFKDCTRSWVLNRILDPREKSAILQILSSVGEEAIDIPFDAKAHYEAFLDVTGLPLERRLSELQVNMDPNWPLELEWAVRFKSQQLVGINSARNHALRIGRERADWTLVLDGGVVFPTAGWAGFVTGVRASPAAKFAIIELERVYDWDAVGGAKKSESVEEPQIAFHRTSTDFFDERLRYGNRNKVELLKRLAVEGPWLDWRSARWDMITPLRSPHRGAYVRAGYVIRLPAGEEKEQSADQRQRFANRFIGVAQRSAEMDLQYARSHRNPDREFTLGMPQQRSPGKDAILQGWVSDWLTERDRVITDKSTLPPSGDLHDYFSTAPYRTDDGQSLDGIVQDRRGVDDPSSGYFDRESMLRFIRRVYGLTMAGRLLGRRELFAKPVELLQDWFMSPVTRMNPSMRHAQIIAGQQVANEIGMVEFREFCYLPYAIKVLEQEGALSSDDVDKIRTWFSLFIADCEQAGVVNRVLERRNNISTWAVAILGTMALFTNAFSKSFFVVRTASLRMGTQLGPLSLQFHETERTRPLHYSLFNLNAWWSLSRLGKEFGVDLSRFTGFRGESLREAVAICADNRQRFSDYGDDPASFDSWLDLLTGLFGGSRTDDYQLVTKPYLGLPPIIMPDAT